jgi:Ubiquitin-conjugating enzyme
MSMLAEPNDESPANVEAAKMWRDNREKFHEKVKNQVLTSLGLGFVGGDFQGDGCISVGAKLVDAPSQP